MGDILKPSTGLAAIAIALAWLLPVHGETLMDKAEQSKTLSIAGDDPAMKAAFAKAQATLDGFIDVLDNKRPGIEQPTVKVPITDQGQTEFFWIIDVGHDGNKFTGTIDNQPEFVHSVVDGQKFSFDRSEIADWGYFENGELKGNFTTCVLLSREDPQEVKELEARVHLTCP